MKTNTNAKYHMTYKTTSYVYVRLKYNKNIKTELKNFYNIVDVGTHV